MYLWSHSTSTQVVQVYVLPTLNSKHKFWEQTYRVDHHPRARLATGWPTCRTDVNRTAETLKTELISEPWPTVSQSQVVKTKTSTLSLWFKQYPETHNIAVNMSRTQSQTTQHAKIQENVNFHGKTMTDFGILKQKDFNAMIIKKFQEVRVTTLGYEWKTITKN